MECVVFDSNWEHRTGARRLTRSLANDTPSVIAMMGPHGAKYIGTWWKIPYRKEGA